MNSQRRALRSLLAALSVAALAGACSGANAIAPAPSESSTALTVESSKGPVAAVENPSRVAALDNTSFQTLHDWGIQPVALPKALLPQEGFEDWAADPSIADIGNHREPKLELLSEAAPDLILGGYRFESFEDDLNSIALTTDLAPLEDAEGGWNQSLITQTTSLGEIFNKEEEAAALVAEFQEALAAAQEAAQGQTVFLAVVSGGKIDNGADRIGRLIQDLNVTDVFAGEEGDIHGDSGLAPETIAQANPDWVIVMDRDAATAQGEAATPAEKIFAAQEAFEGTTFMEQDHIIYLDPFFYTTEGIHAYTAAYQQIADAFAQN